MESLSHDPYINHFSHPHPLELSNPQSVYITSCSACKLQSSGWMYSCKPCNFTLHISCAQMPTLITHHSHLHPLTLFSTPAYPSGSFNCDGCGCQGNGFSYRCATCGFDLHVKCATNPLSLAHQSHPHQLNLTFYPPYQTGGFSCDICHKIGSNHWLYRCGACNFYAHMECAMSVNNTLVPHIQHSNSLPVANNASIQYQQQPGPAGGNYVYRHSQRMGAMPMQQQRPNAAGNGTIMGTMAQGFAVGAAQQTGQMFVQSIINPDANGGTRNNNNDPNGGGDNSSDPSIISIVSSILSGVFGGD